MPRDGVGDDHGFCGGEPDLIAAIMRERGTDVEAGCSVRVPGGTRIWWVECENFHAQWNEGISVVVVGTE